MSDLPIGLNALIPWGRPSIGIALPEGVREIDAAGAFEVYSVSYAARAVPLTMRGTVTTKHGMVLLTNTPHDAPHLARLAVPGPAGTAIDPQLRAWATGRHLAIDAIHRRVGNNGFDAALDYLADQAGRRTAVSAAKMIDYPISQAQLDDTRVPPRITVLLCIGLLVAGAAATLPALVIASAKAFPVSATLATTRPSAPA